MFYTLLESCSDHRKNNGDQIRKEPLQRKESGDSNNSRGPNWISSLVSPFKSRKTQEKEESAKT